MDFDYKKYLPNFCTVILVTCMVFAAEFFGSEEIIFPEITALTVGYLVAPKRSWMVNGRRMLILITGCAILGVLIVRYLPFSVFTEVMIAFILAQILFMFSQTTFAPFVSAIVLPVMIRTTSFIYPLAAAILTFIIIILHKLFIRMGVIEDEDYVPVMLNTVNDRIDTVLRILVVLVVGFLAFRLGFKFVIAPPLLVAFTELSRPLNKTRTKPFKTIFVITAASLVGTFFRFVLNLELELPLTVVAACITIALLFIVHLSGMYMPPAGAIAILSLIVPKDVLLIFPLQILVGITTVVFVSRLLFMRRQEKMLEE